MNWQWQCEHTSKSTDNIIILKTLYRVMRPGESIWLMRLSQRIIPRVLLKTLASSEVLLQQPPLQEEGYVFCIVLGSVHLRRTPTGNLGQNRKGSAIQYHRRHLLVVVSGKCKFIGAQASRTSNRAVGLLGCARTEARLKSSVLVLGHFINRLVLFSCFSF